MMTRASVPDDVSYEAFLSCLFTRPIHIVFYTGITREVEIDVFLGLVAPDAQLFPKPERRHSVYQTEVDCLRRAAFIVGDGIRFDAEYFGSGRTMNVSVLRERCQQTGVLRKMRHDPQLDLRVIRGKQPVPRRRNECLPDTSSLGCANRNILQVGVGRGKASGRGNRLVV
jgi:hypothetical protein